MRRHTHTHRHRHAKLPDDGGRATLAAPKRRDFFPSLQPHRLGRSIFSGQLALRRFAGHSFQLLGRCNGHLVLLLPSVDPFGLDASEFWFFRRVNRKNSNCGRLYGRGAGHIFDQVRGPGPVSRPSSDPDRTFPGQCVPPSKRLIPTSAPPLGRPNGPAASFRLSGGRPSIQSAVFRSWPQSPLEHLAKSILRRVAGGRKLALG